MKKVARELNMIATEIVTAGRNYDQMIKMVDNAKVKDIPRGVVDLTYVFAEILNGGLEQAVSHGYGDKLKSALRVLRSFGNKSAKMGSMLQRLEPSPFMSRSAFDRMTRGMDEEEFEIELSEWEKFDSWFYANDDGVFREVVQYLEKELPRVASRFQDSDKDIAEDVISRVVNRRRTMQQAFKEIGYSDLYKATRATDLPLDFNELDVRKQVKELEKAIAKARKRVS